MDFKDFAFGLEIELTGLPRKAAIKTLEAALIDSHVFHEINKNKITDTSGRIWKIVNDTSITKQIHHSYLHWQPEEYISADDLWSFYSDAENCEIECVTPICTLDDWPVIQRIIRYFRKNMAKVNTSCGIHIHLSISSFTKFEVIKLSTLVGLYEPLLYKVLGVHDDRLNYAKKMPHDYKKTSNRIFKYGYGTMEELSRNWFKEFVIHEHRKTRYRGLNLYNYYKPILNKPTIEFRYFNSTLHAGKIRTYLYLTLALAKKAKEIKDYSRILYRASSINTITQFEKWLKFMELDKDPIIENHLKTAFSNEHYFK